MSDNEKKIIKVELYGKSFKVRSDDEEYLHGIARRIDDLMQQIGRGKQPFEISLVLAALTLGDELSKAENKIEEFLKIETRLGEQIDAVLDGDVDVENDIDIIADEANEIIEKAPEISGELDDDNPPGEATFEDYDN